MQNCSPGKDVETMTLNRLFEIVPLLAVALTLSGCEAIGAVFQAGMWAGVFMVVLILAVVGFIAAKIRG